MRVRDLAGLLPRFAALALFAALPFASASPAEEGSTSYSAEERAAAREELDERLRDCEPLPNCAEISARVIFVERPGGALEELAREHFFATIAYARSALLEIWDAKPDAETRARILDLFREHWGPLSRGVWFKLTTKVIEALESDDERLRNAAAHLAAVRPVHSLRHAIVDAAYEHPELTEAALLSIALNRDHLTGRWVVRQLNHPDERVRKAARYAIFSIGRPASAPLREVLDGSHPELEDAAVEALLMVATIDDVTLLMDWLASQPERDDELSERVLRSVAEIEAGVYERPFPQKPAYEPTRASPAADAEHAESDASEGAAQAS